MPGSEEPEGERRALLLCPKAGTKCVGWVTAAGNCPISAATL